MRADSMRAGPVADPGRGSAHALSAARAALLAAESIVVLSGAGISTDSGIPDFRGPQGVWTADPEAEKRSDITHFLADPVIREAKWRDVSAERAGARQPNPGHAAIAQLAEGGRVLLVITQNTDSLHLESGIDPSLVVEVHGSHREACCVSCGARTPLDQVLQRFNRGERDPRCRELVSPGRVCGGILKPGVVFFGEELDRAAFKRAEDAVARADVLLCVGTSLNVYPVAGLVSYARYRHHATVIIVNAEPTEADRHADVVVRGQLSELLPAIVG